MTSRIKIVKLFYTICNKCGSKCCKPTLLPAPYNLNLKPGDFTKLIKMGYHTLLNIGQDINRGEAFIIKPHIFGYCPLLDYNSNKCTIYDHRPKMCSVFPFDPRSKEDVKEYCMVLQKTKGEKLKEIQNNLLKYYQSVKYERLENKHNNEDVKSFRTEFQPFLTKFLEEKRLINNSWGSFIIHSKFKEDITFLDEFSELMHRYCDFFKQKEVTIKAGIVNREFDSIINILGILSPNRTFDEYAIMNKLKIGSYYFTSTFDGSFLEGVIFDYELNKKFSSWFSCWAEMKQAIKGFKPMR